MARKNIFSTIRETPVVSSAHLTSYCNAPIYLKLEHLQITGSFKLRGATNAILNLTERQRKNGVVGVSTGNHGRGLAYAARAANVRCIICMSKLVPQNKIDGIRSHGAEVLIIGNSQDEAQVEVERLVKEEGMTMVPPFDHPDIICGQGTIGLEIFEALPDLRLAIVPISGGGLVSGVAKVLKEKVPNCKIIGVSMENGASMYACQKAGNPILIEEKPTLADSLSGGIGLDNRYTFEMTSSLVDEIQLVSELEIAEAIRHAYWKESQIIEGSGAVSLAALISGKIRPSGLSVALICGGNIDMNLHHRIISGENVDMRHEYIRRKRCPK